MIDGDELARQVRYGERSAEEIVRDAIRAIEALDPALNAVIHRRFEKAIEEARAPRAVHWPACRSS